MNILTIKMESYNVELEDELANQQCEICGRVGNEQQILLCDHCSKAFHVDCIGLVDIPIDSWFCI